jgi:hypothetical protein
MWSGLSGTAGSLLLLLCSGLGVEGSVGAVDRREQGNMKKKAAATEYNPRRAGVLEAIVELYMRLNGYFCIRNYLHHRFGEFGLDTESDLLAVRMPHQHELLEDGRQPNDTTLVLCGKEVDCVIVEVKEPSVEFNARVRGHDGARLIGAALRMFGVFPEASFDNGGAALSMEQELHRQVTENRWPNVPTTISTEHNVSVRMIVFAPAAAKHASERAHFDLQHVLDFVRRRMRPGEPCARYRDPAVPSASPWRGDTRRIVEVLDESFCRGEARLDLEQFLKEALSKTRIPGGANRRTARRTY